LIIGVAENMKEKPFHGTIPVFTQKDLGGLALRVFMMFNKVLSQGYDEKTVKTRQMQFGVRRAGACNSRFPRFNSVICISSPHDRPYGVISQFLR
jgi:hypothetical protein